MFKCYEQLLFSCVSSKLSICNYVTCHMSHVTCHMSLVTCHLSLVTYCILLYTPEVIRNPKICNMMGKQVFTCHKSQVTCHMSHVTCHLSLGTYCTECPKKNATQRNDALVYHQILFQPCNDTWFTYIGYQDMSRYSRNRFHFLTVHPTAPTSPAIQANIIVQL